MAEPPPLLFPDGFLKLPKIRPRPLQKRILQYLHEGGRPSTSAISTDLDVWRFSAQRCLRIMKNHGLVEDQWAWFAPSVVPGIKTHTWAITNQGRKELDHLQSIKEPAELHPLGYRILLFMSHGNLMTIGPIAKMTGARNGQVRRVIESLQNKGLVVCLHSRTRTSFGHDVITHLWRITKLGQEMLDRGPTTYLRTVRSQERCPMRV